MTELDLAKRTIEELKTCTSITRKGRNIAKLALEKQIPKKFLHIHRNMDCEGAMYTLIHCECHTCGWSWNTMCDGQEHCVKCGQALDWRRI